MILTTGCVSQNEFADLNSSYSKLEKNNSDLIKLSTEKDNEIQSLKRTNEELATKVNQLKSEYDKLRYEFEEVSQTPENYYKTACDLINAKDYKHALTKLIKLTQSFPNSNLVLQSKKRINEIENISNSNLNEIVKEVKSSATKDKIIILENKLCSNLLSSNDSISLSKMYNKIVEELELEENINVSEDKMQSCFFYETDRAVYQDVGNASLYFELYIIKYYSGEKHLRLRTQYTNKDWMFYDKVMVRGSNGAQFEIQAIYPNKQTEINEYGVKEWSDNIIDIDLEKTIIKISTADSVNVRFVGKYCYEMKLDKRQMLVLKEMISKYKSL